MVHIPFGEWQPDLGANENPGALEAKNCIPEKTDYRHFNGLQGFATALGNMANGSFWLRSSGGVVNNFVGDPTHLYKFNGISAWADVSKPAAAYSASAWDFVNFQDRVIATDGGASDLQYYDAATSVTFLDLPGSPPRCRVVGVVRDFLVLGNYAIGAEIESGGLAWSGFNNTELWTPSLSTQCGRRRTRGTGGQVQRIISGTQGMVFREGSILLMSYVGPPNIFQVDDLTTLHGTPAPRSVCWTKDKAFYYADEGFHMIDRRTQAITAIGAGRFDKWFVDNAAASDVVNMQGTVDRKNNLVYWAFRSSTSSPTFDRILVYNWAFDRPAWAEIAVEFIGEFASVGYNLDTIGAILGGDIDSASIPVDSDAYSGGALSLLGFSPLHVSSTFDGTPLVAEIDTTEFAVEETHRGYTNGVRPVVEATTSPVIQVAPLTRNLISANPVLGSFGNLNAETGLADIRVNARYHRYRIKIAGGFTHAKRIELELKKRGRR